MGQVQISAVALMIDYTAPRLAGPNLLTNPGAETGDLTGWTSTQPSGGGDFSASASSPHTGTFKFAPGPKGVDFASKTLSQEINLITEGYSPLFLDSSPFVEVGGWQNSFAGDDTGQIVVEFLDGPGGSVLDTFNGPVITPTVWTETFHIQVLPNGARAVLFKFIATHVAGANTDGYLDDAFVRFDVSAPGTTTGPPATTTTTPPTTTSGPEPHPADTGPGTPNFRFSTSEVLSYANAFLTDDDGVFPGISGPNRSAYVLRAAAILLDNFQSRYEDVGTAAAVDSMDHPLRWQSLPDSAPLVWESSRE